MDQKGEAQRIEAEEEVFSHSSVLAINAKKISLNDLDCQVNYYKKNKTLFHTHQLPCCRVRENERKAFLY